MRETQLAATALGIEPPYNQQDMDRIGALLELIGIEEVPIGWCGMPEGHLNIPEEECLYNSEKGCWLNAPDSIVKCEGKCNCFTLRET